MSESKPSTEQKLDQSSTEASNTFIKATNDALISVGAFAGILGLPIFSSLAVSYLAEGNLGQAAVTGTLAGIAAWNLHRGRTRVLELKNEQRKIS